MSGYLYCTSVLFFCVLNCGLLATAEKAAGLYWSVAAGYWGWGWGWPGQEVRFRLVLDIDFTIFEEVPNYNPSQKFLEPPINANAMMIFEEEQHFKQ